MKCWLFDHVIDCDTPQQVIQAYKDIQWTDYSDDEWFKVLKNRMKVYTGKEEILFYNERQLVDLLFDLDIVSPVNENKS